jgi:hypothetical protein
MDRQHEEITMRLFDEDKIGCYLDAIGHRIEKTSDGDPIKMIDLTLRVQPLTAALASALDLDAHAELFRLNDGSAKEIVKSIEFAIRVPNQRILIYATPDIPDPSTVLLDAEITSVRARTEKNVDGFALVFYASVGPVDRDQLEYVCRWHGEQRFLTFDKQQPALDFEPVGETPKPPRRPRAVSSAQPEVH